MATATKNGLTGRANREIRDFLGLSSHNRFPVEIVDGLQEPEIVGEGYHWRNRSGARVHYPSAYNRKAFSSPAIYVPSTRAIQVGRGWLEAEGLL